MTAQDLNFQQLSTVQSNVMPAPVTIASATTIAPTTFISVVSGTTAVVNVTPPVSGAHMLVFIPSGAFTTTTAGNLLNALTAAVNIPMLLFYNPLTAKYMVGEAIGT
jgi:hypothetical protein